MHKPVIYKFSRQALFNPASTVFSPSIITVIVPFLNTGDIGIFTA